MFSSDTDKVRILKFMTRFGIGGTEKQVLNLSKRLDRTRFDLHFGCLDRWGQLADDFESEGFSLDEYPIKRLYGYNTQRQQWKLARSLLQNRIQLVHSYNFYANVFAVPAAKFARVPCVIASVRDLGVYMTPAQCRVQKWACGMADIVLVNAAAIRDWLVQQGLAERKIRVVYNGVDVETFQAAGTGKAFRLELGIPLQTPIVTMLARLDPNKGLDYFLRAAPGILERRPDTHFVVVGETLAFEKGAGATFDDTQGREFVRRATELGITDHIHFVGERSDVAAILSATTVSVLPSTSEGLSNTLLESMAAGSAVVATNVGGTPELIRDGREGLLVPPCDSHAIVEAVSSILEDDSLARRLSAQGLKRVRTSFSFEETTRQTEAIYDELIGSRISMASRREEPVHSEPQRSRQRG
jgi:glycosyltransferase involved in cell wall biosynthesis